LRCLFCVSAFAAFLQFIGAIETMSQHSSGKRSNPVIRFLIENSLFLIGGAVAALLWANFSQIEGGESSYQRFIHFEIASLWNGGEHGHVAGTETTPHHAADHHAAAVSNEVTAAESGGHHGITVHFLVSDVLMALFFAIAVKEVWESMLPGGSLNKPRQAATPLLATVGGVLGPAVVYLVGCYLFKSEEMARGWAIPCATDIAFSYLIARVIFGGNHPAIAFLLLLAIADDACGLAILAIFYPKDAIDPRWLMLTVTAMGIAWAMRRGRLHSHWWYIGIPGVLSWFSFYYANIHPALGLVPIIPMMPHAQTDLGIFAREELDRHDTLNEFEHFWKTPVEIILGLFGLVSAGVVLNSLTPGTYLVLAGLLVGKPVGILLMTLVAEKVFGLEKPAGMDYRHVAVLGMVAGLGFTVALFVSGAAFPVAGPIQDAAKMGALLSFAAAPLAILMARLMGIRPQPANAVAPSTKTAPVRVKSGSAHPA